MRKKSHVHFLIHVELFRCLLTHLILGRLVLLAVAARERVNNGGLGRAACDHAVALQAADGWAEI